MKPSMFATVAVVTLGAALLAAPFEMTRSTIDGGGAVRSAGGDYELSGTIGQPDAGVLAGGSFEITGGFWFALPPGDCNDDGGTGLSDVAFFEECVTGPAGPTPSGSCRCFDVDGSGVIDLADFAEVQVVFSGD